MAVNELAKEVLDQVASPETQITITIHEYFLTLDPVPTHCALSVFNGQTELPLPVRCKTPEIAHLNVREILEHYHLKADVFVKEHFRRTT